MCVFLLFDDKYKYFLFKKLSYGCSVVYFFVVGGSIQILKFFESKMLDIIIVINNGLNVIDIVCIFNYMVMCMDFIKCS